VIVKLQRKRISHKNSLYVESVDKFERSVYFINESLDEPKKIYYRKITD
jgi:hypothetical protein